MSRSKPADLRATKGCLGSAIAIAGIKKGESIVLSRPTREALSKLAHHWEIADDPALIVGCMVGFFMLRVDLPVGDEARSRSVPDGMSQTPVANNNDELVFDIDWDN